MEGVERLVVFLDIPWRYSPNHNPNFVVVTEGVHLLGDLTLFETGYPNVFVSIQPWVHETVALFLESIGATLACQELNALE